jgi:hypothetical protein
MLSTKILMLEAKETEFWWKEYPQASGDVTIHVIKRMSPGYKRKTFYWTLSTFL